MKHLTIKDKVLIGFGIIIVSMAATVLVHIINNGATF
jgi:hypothetical protein